MVIWPVALSRGLMPSLVHLNHGIAGVASVLFAIPLARCGMARAVVWQARMASAGVLAELYSKSTIGGPGSDPSPLNLLLHGGPR